MTAPSFPASAGEAASLSPSLRRLTRRPQFLAAARGPACARGAVLVQGRPRDDGDPDIGLGFTASRKIGGAVVRNRAKRRLREAARQLVPVHGKPGWDYVLIARSGTAERPWERLLDDVKTALIRLAADWRTAQEPASPARDDPASPGDPDPAKAP